METDISYETVETNEAEVNETEETNATESTQSGYVDESEPQQTTLPALTEPNTTQPLETETEPDIEVPENGLGWG